jgi:hypothetical protein
MLSPKALALLATALGALVSAYAQNGWLKAKGELFTSLNGQHYSSDRYFNISGKELTTNVFNQSSVFFYGEYGLAKKLTLIVSLPLQTWNSFETTKVVSGAGDLKTEFKIPLYRKHTHVSLSVAPELPTGARNLFAQNKQLQFEQINLPTGDGEWNVWTTLAASRSHKTLPLYFSIFSAYNKRTEYAGFSFRDQFRAGMGIGYRWFPQLITQLKLMAQERIGKETSTTDFTRGDGSTFTIYTIEMAYRFYEQWSLALRFTDFVSWPTPSRNVYQAGVLGGGIYYTIQRANKK